MSATIHLPGFAVVTGAASGMGQAAAKALVLAGVHGIALVDINATGLETTKKLLTTLVSGSSITPRILAIECDTSSAKSVEHAFSSINADFKRIDYSLHCAGIVRFMPSVDQPPDDFDLQTNVNYRGTWLCQRAAISIMRTQSLNHEAYPDANIPSYRAQRGAIVNISSVGAIKGIPTTTGYCASKAAVFAMTRGDAFDYAPDRVRINAVLPGIIDTPMTNPDPETKKALEAGPMQNAPMKRFGLPEEVVDVMMFLCSSAASYVTGAGWVVDGGMLTN